VAGIIVADTIQSGGSFIRLNSASQTVATINASGIYANTGNLLIAANGTIGVASITNTAITGTITQAQIGNAVTTTGPAFGAYLNSNQSVSNGVETKVQLSVEEFDTASCFDTSLYRFTPNIAGYYQINAAIKFGSNINDQTIIHIYKNGSSVKRGGQMGAMTNDPTCVASALIYMNGITDYIELYGLRSSSVGTSQFNSGSTNTYMNGFLARAA
jgi:hypothetical protein